MSVENGGLPPEERPAGEPAAVTPPASVLRKLVLILVIGAFCMGADQVTKAIARETLSFHYPKSYFGDLFRFHYTENAGAMLGFGSELPDDLRFWLFVVFTGFLLLLMPVYILLSTRMRYVQIIALSLTLGGGLSNLIDRIFNEGRVVDFMNVGIGNFRTGIFNVADMLILAGIGLLLLSVFTQREE